MLSNVLILYCESFENIQKAVFIIVLFKVKGGGSLDYLSIVSQEK